MAPSEQDVFEQALAFADSDERAAYIAQACHADESLRRRVEALVAAYLDSDYLELPAQGIENLNQAWQEGILIGTTIGPYSIVERIGEGGMGDVYLARRSDGNRVHVALKVIKPGMDSRQLMARFELERTGLAKMDHPHIAKFIEAGISDRGRVYFVMELVRGLSITDYCDRNRLPIERRLKLIVDLCLAVEHAHSKGLIHRDLKPSNVLVTEVDGEPVVKVIDFGVAKAFDREPNDKTIFTHPIQFIGTPTYMSPEQVRWCPDVDFRSDVYSIGVLLYELLAGSPPIDQSILRSAGLEEMRQVILDEEAAPPSVRIASLPANVQAVLAASRRVSTKQLKLQIRGDLDWIALTALAKDRSLRYTTAGDLAADINRHLTHQDVQARPPRMSTRLRKWSRRHSRSLKAGVLSATLLGIALTAYLAAALFRNNIVASAASATADHLAYCRDMQQAWVWVVSGDRPAALSLLEKHSPSLPHRPEVGFEWHMIHDLAAAKPLRVFQGAASAVLSADISPDRRWVASGDRSGAVRIWNANTAQLVQTLQIDGGETTAVKFSPDGKWLAWTGIDRIVHLARTGKWDDEIKLQKHTATVCSIAWSPDSKWLASAGRDHSVFIWNIVKSRHHRSLFGHTDAVRCVAWSPDGKYLATSNGTQGILLWDTKEWQQLHALDSAGTGTLCIRFSPNSRRVAFGGYDSVLSVANVDNPKTLVHVATRRQIWSLEYITDYRILAGLGDGQVQLFRAVTRRPPNNSHVTSEWVTTVKNGGTYRSIVAAENGEAFLVAREQDRAVELVRAADLLGYRPPPIDTSISRVAGNHVLMYDKKTRTTKVRNVQGGDAVPIDIDVRHECPPAYSEAAKLLAVARNDGSICFFNSEDWTLQKSVPISSTAFAMSFSHDGRFLAVGCEQGQFQVIDVLHGHVDSISKPRHTSFSLVRYSPVEDLLAIADIGKTELMLLHGPKLDQVKKLTTSSGIQCIRFSPQGDKLAVGEIHGVSLWDIPALQPAGLYGGHSRLPLALDFSANGRTVCSVDTSSIHLWDADTALGFCTIPIWECPEPWLAFADDKTLLIGDVMTGIYHCFGGNWATDHRFRSPAAIERP